MITLKELIGKPQQMPWEHAANLEDLLKKLNKFRSAYGKPLQVTSGYRSLEHHLAIYAAKGITDKAKIPMRSLHLTGCAADVAPIEDNIKHLQEWILNNEPLMIEIGLWFESFEHTPTWCHIQIIPPKSGKRFFQP